MFGLNSLNVDVMQVMCALQIKRGAPVAANPAAGGSSGRAANPPARGRRATSAPRPCVRRGVQNL